MKRTPDPVREPAAPPFVGWQYSEGVKRAYEAEAWNEHDKKIEKEEQNAAIAAEVVRLISASPPGASSASEMSNGQRCCRIQDEMRAIRNKHLHGKTVAAIREANPEYLVWSEVDGLDKDELETFHRPRMWEGGYIDAFLGRRYERAPSTIIGWKKKYRRSVRESRSTPRHSK